MDRTLSQGRGRGKEEQGDQEAGRVKGQRSQTGWVL